MTPWRSVSKNGSRKEFFKNLQHTRATTGDWVVVEATGGGFDVGTVTLTGELVRLQMKRKRVRQDARLGQVVRKAHERDLERLDEVRREERDILIPVSYTHLTLPTNSRV